jgi:hypothetical protein
MIKKLVMFVSVLLVAGSMVWAAPDKSWTGVVSESGCGLKHATASDEAASCVEGCVAKGSKYVLVSDGKVYQVSPQDKFKGMGGKSVKVTGKMKGESITAAAVEPAM